MPLLRFHSVVLFVGLLAGASVVRAESPRDRLLVTPAWLAQHAGDANLVLLHVGEKTEYDGGHIAGARFVTTRDLAQPPGDATSLTLEMPDAEHLRTQIMALGVSERSHVIVYYGKDWVSPATRIVFTLLYAGLKDVSLLDGGMPAWTAQGHALTADVPPTVTGTLPPLTPKPLVVDASFVQSHAQMPGFAIVDARATVFFDGTQEGGPRDKRKAGHIAGARSVPFTTMVTDSNTWKSNEELAAIFRAAGVKDGDTVVAYCHIGQQATATIFGAMTIGHPVLLYDGSFEDWARRDLPVQR
jgi:thiosulfate/3-mercaptopyruvate sulfurtransferase